MPNTCTSVLTRQVTHAITVFHIRSHSFSQNKKISIFLKQQFTFCNTFKKKKTKNTALQTTKKADLSQLMAETLSGMRICTESKISQMCEQAQGHRKGDV